MVLFRITENEPSKMHNVRPYVYSRPCSNLENYNHFIVIILSADNVILFRSV